MEKDVFSSTPLKQKKRLGDKAVEMYNCVAVLRIGILIKLWSCWS